MRIFPLLWLAPAAALLGAAVADGPAPRAGAEAERAAALSFLESLSEEQRSKAVLPFTDPDRLAWQFVPADRTGLSLGEMDDGQRRHAFALLRSALSSQGSLKASGILLLEEVLQEAERARGRSGDFRDPGRYWFAIYGRPASEAPWGWRLEGHHLSLNFTVGPRGEWTATPHFLGTNPAEVRSGRRAGLRVLAAEEDKGRLLLRSLRAEQRARAVIAESAPRDILLGPDRTEGFAEPAGLAAADLDEGQRRLLRSLIAEYVDNLRESSAAEEWARIGEAGFERIHFAWAGADEKGQGHYYRVHGPTFVIEYDNTQNGANHVHTVWRDPQRDFGADWLRRHYAEAHAPR